MFSLQASFSSHEGEPHTCEVYSQVWSPLSCEREDVYNGNIHPPQLELGCWLLLLLLLLLFALIKGSASNSTVNLIMPSRGSKLSTPAFIHYLIIQFKRIVNEFKESENIRKSIIFRSKTLKNLHKPSRTRWNSLLNHKNIHIYIYIYIHIYFPEINRPLSSWRP